MANFTALHAGKYGEDFVQSVNVNKGKSCKTYLFVPAYLCNVIAFCMCHIMVMLTVVVTVILLG